MFNGEYIVNLTSKVREDNPILVSEVKTNLHLLDSESDDDAEIEGLIDAAVSDAQDYCDHYFAPTQLTYSIFNFNSDVLKVEISPYIEITTIETSDDGISYTDISSLVFVEKGESYFKIYFSETVDAKYMNLVIRVGYEIDEIPTNAKRAIIIKASDMYDTERSDYAMKEKNIYVYKNLLSNFQNRRW